MVRQKVARNWKGARLRLLFSSSDLGPGLGPSDWTVFVLQAGLLHEELALLKRRRAELRQELRTAAQQDKKLRKRRANLVKAVRRSSRHVAGDGNW